MFGRDYHEAVWGFQSTMTVLKEVDLLLHAEYQHAYVNVYIVQ